MEIDNKLITSVLGAALAAGLGTGAVNMSKKTQMEEKKDLKFASYEELARSQLEACEAREIACRQDLVACWTSK